MSAIAKLGPGAAAPGLMFASGFAGLGYQIVWTQQCALWLGHEAAAVLAVVAAFFGGLAAGAFLLGRRIEASANPVAGYAACELVIALWGLVVAFAMAPLSAVIVAAMGAEPGPARQWSAAFFGCVLLLLPATMAMGATLPAMARIVGAGRGPVIAPLYAWNTAGAVFGVLACAFWLVPGFGLLRTATICVALNLACGLLAPRLLRGTPPSPAASTAARGPLLRLALSGLLGIGYEVIVVRVLSEVAEDTVYTFAMLLAIYLVGTTAGAALYARRRKQHPAGAGLREALLLSTAIACVAGAISLWGAEAIKSDALQIFGAGMAAALAAEALLALIAFAAPTVATGALFSHLAAEAGAGGGFAGGLAVNTLGAALAPALFGVALLPAFGPKLALVILGFGYLALIAPGSWRRPRVAATAAALLALALFAPPLAFIEVPDGGRVVSYRDGVTAAVSVVEDADGVRRLRIDNRQQEGTSATRRVDGRQALLPLLLHPAPRRALFLGLGTGTTAAVAAEDPALAVDAVELLSEVIAAAPLFGGIVSGSAEALRLRLVAADARRFVRASARTYDVIVADNFHPARSGSGALYTVEHFAAVRARLAPGGLFCQWLPLHQLDLDTLRSIVHSFLAIYPGGWALLANNGLDTPVIGLVGRADGGRFEVARVRERIAQAQPPSQPVRFGIDDEFALLGSFIAGPATLQRFAAAAPRNTDDRPVVAYRAPRITYAPASRPRDRLVDLLRSLSIEPRELLAPMEDGETARRLAAYWQARTRFIEAGREVRPVADPAAMLAQVREPLLAVLHLSPDFRPAYDPLLAMAATLIESDPERARVLLRQLVEVQPARREAAAALDRLDVDSGR